VDKSSGRMEGIKYRTEVKYKNKVVKGAGRMKDVKYRREVDTKYSIKQARNREWK
jgi:hypothetical protein